MISRLQHRERSASASVNITLTQAARWLLALIGLLLVCGSVLGHGALALVAGAGFVACFALRHWLDVLTSDLTRLSVKVIDSGPFSRKGPGSLIVPIQLAIGDFSSTRWVKIRPEVSKNARQPEAWIHVRSNSTGKTDLKVELHSFGHWSLRGVTFTEQLLGLVQVSSYCPLEVHLHVWPSSRHPFTLQRPETLHVRHSALSSAPAPRTGLRGDFRELRTYQAGDPPSMIAWKASAKRQELLVRSWHADAHHRTLLLLNMGPSTRHDHSGSRPLDQAISLTTSIIEENPDRHLGIIAYDHRIYLTLDVGGGPEHRHQCVRALISLTSVIDEDLTEVSTVELMISVARYLWLHRGKDNFWRVPTRNKHLPDYVFRHPEVRLLDTDLLFQAVTNELRRFRQKSQQLLRGKQRVAKNLFAARLRVFCALNHIPLPYRLGHVDPEAYEGLKRSLRYGLRLRPLDSIVIITSTWPSTMDPMLTSLIHQYRRQNVTIGVEPTAALTEGAYRSLTQQGLFRVSRLGQGWS